MLIESLKLKNKENKDMENGIQGLWNVIKRCDVYIMRDQEENKVQKKRK